MQESANSVLTSCNRKGGARRVILWVVVGLLSLAYFVTSAIVVVNAFIWTPTLPSLWYKIQNAMYLPFEPYFGLAFQLLGERVPYTTYAVVTRVPILLLGIAIPLVLRRYLRCK